MGNGRRRTIAPAPEREREQESGVRSWLKKPVVWLLTVVVGAVAVFMGDHVRAFMATAFPVEDTEQTAGVDPINVVDVKRELSGVNLLLPGEPDLAGWDRKSLPDEAWLGSHNAVNIGTSRWQIVLEGRRTKEVVITSMKPNVLGCEEPLRGSVIENPSAGGGDKFKFDVQIDKPNPEFRVTERDGKTSNYFDDKTIKLPKGEQNVVVITATTARQYCRWTVDVEYLADGKRQQMSIKDPHGKPFSVTGGFTLAEYDWVFLSGSQRVCPEPYRRVSGAEFGALTASGSPCGK